MLGVPQPVVQSEKMLGITPQVRRKDEVSARWNLAQGGSRNRALSVIATVDAVGKS